MNFILPFQIPKAVQTIGYNQKILCMGSCFAQEIGELIQLYQFPVMLNPNGILFNSISIADAIKSYIENSIYQSDDLVFDQGLWHSLKHHGVFSDPQKDLCLDKINHTINTAHNFLKEADWLCITLGSSFVYRYLPDGNVVANCHKIPQKYFVKELLDYSYQTASLLEMIAQIRSFNQDLKILFTVSPVKYTKDGLVENNLSKAQLLTTVHTLCKNNDHCFYFPAYELVTDVLRDYRFYKEDMVHPNEQAIKFVWEHFIETYLNSDDKSLFSEVAQWVRFSGHRPLNNSEPDEHSKSSELQFLNIEKKLNSRKSNQLL